jgi:peptidoglycan hydrolase-like protein with peptidoglycan-binding domain
MLTSDGIIGNVTWEELLKKRPDKILRMGASGKDVEWIQKVINKTIAAQLKVDGVFGNDTQVAVKSFQKKNALIEDGIIGPKTWWMLRNKSNPKPSK